MKKNYLSLLCLLSITVANAQRVETGASLPLTKNTYTVANKVNHTTYSQKAEGDVLWSDNFDNPSDWVHVSGTGQVDGPGGTGHWNIVTDLTPSLVTQSQAGYGFPIAMNSASGGNFALINSDEATNTANQDAYFECQTVIDLSGLTGGTAISIEFDNIFRHYMEQFWMEVSNDNGTTWTPFQINAATPTNTNSLDPEHELVNVTSANLAGSATVKIRFHYIGAWDWFWGIDDVKMTETWMNDGAMISTVMGTDATTTQGADYYMIPTSQASFPGQVFRTVAQNNGYATQANFASRATCAAASYDELSGPGIVYGASFAAGEIDTFDITVPFNPTAPGTYDVMVSTDLGTADSYTDNDTTSFRGIIYGGNDYARDNGIMTSTLTRFQDDQIIIVGWANYFNIFDTYNAGSIKTYIPSSQSSGFVTDYVHASVDRYNGTDWDIDVMTTEALDITSDYFGAWLTLNSDMGIVPLDAGLYRVVFHRTQNGDNTLRLAMAQASPEGTVIAVLEDGTSNGLASPNAIMMRLSTDNTFGIKENTLNFGLNVYPNPANSQATISFNVNTPSNVIVTLTDVTGKVAYTNNLGKMNIGGHTTEINTDSLSNGVYMVNVSVNGVSNTQKLIIKK